MSDDKEEPDEAIRVQKYIANLGICSRRKAEVLIAEGRVSIDDDVATLGQRVIPGTSRVTVDGDSVGRRKRAQHITLMMNKPRGVLCSNADPYHEKTVFSLLPREYQKIRLFCAGRLDLDSEGMLILTNDGELANVITHPSGNVCKRYRAVLNKDLELNDITKMIHGVRRDGETLRAKKMIRGQKGENAARRVEVHLSQGRKREIRRLFEAFGYHVKRLKRFQIGNLVLKGMALGTCRVLNAQEIKALIHEPSQK